MAKPMLRVPFPSVLILIYTAMWEAYEHMILKGLENVEG